MTLEVVGFFHLRKGEGIGGLGEKLEQLELESEHYLRSNLVEEDGNDIYIRAPEFAEITIDHYMWWVMNICDYLRRHYNWEIVPETIAFREIEILTSGTILFNDNVFR